MIETYCSTASALPEIHMASLSSLTHYLSGGFGLVGLLLTIFCLIHALRTRQNFWWYLLLLLLPPFGALLYLFVVIFNGQGNSVQFSRPERGSGAIRRRIQDLENQLAQTDTIALRSELGQSWLKLDEYDRAAEYFRSCLQGNFKNDPFVLYGLSQACHGQGEFEQALTTLEKTFRDDYRDYLNERLFLKAKILAALNRPREALEIYAQTGNHFSSPEFYCRQALLHDDLGEADKANAFYMIALRQGEKLSSEELKEARSWLDTAAKHLSSKQKME